MGIHSNSKIVDSIDQFVESNNLLPQNSRVLLGLSGGPDSVFLLHYLCELQKKSSSTVIAAHLDHQWREESGEDAAYCTQLAQKFGIDFELGKISELAKEVSFTGSREEVARLYRRFFFEKLVAKHKCNCIALAHHRQDQVETFFIRLIRGTSLVGLTSIKPKSGPYVRPLLNTNKQDILDYLNNKNISYLTDPTNESSEFLRNRIRNEALPALRKCDDRFDRNLEKTIERLSAADNFIEKIVLSEYDRITKKNGQKIIFDTSMLDTIDPFLHPRLILKWLCDEKVPFTPSDGFIKEILRFITTKRGGEHALNTSWCIVKSKGLAKIKRQNP